MKLCICIIQLFWGMSIILFWKSEDIDMDKNSIEMIELEIAILYKRASFKSNSGNLVRSAYLILHQIFTHGPSGVKVLANEFQVDISTISRQAAALEKKGYLYKIPNPDDGRAYSFQITDLGKKELNMYKEFRLAKLKELLSEWSEEEKEMFGKLLRKFNLIKKDLSDGQRFD